MHNDTVVADTSVLIAFEKLGILDLLCKIYKKILIPEAVLQEYGTKLNNCFQVKKVNDIRLLGIIRDFNIGKGESEAIGIAFENDLPILIDDQKARKIAKKLYLKVSGTIGVLVKLYNKNLIESAYQKALELKLKGFFISNKILEELNKFEKK